MKFTGERFIPTIEDDTEITIEHLQRYNAIKELVKGKIVLDAACGEGYGTNLLSQYAAHVYGIDIDEEAVNQASKKYIGENLKFINASIEKLPFDDHTLDVVISFETIEHVSIEIQNIFLNEVKRVLKEDGILVISTPNKAIYSDEFNYNNKFHVKEFYYEEFLCFLETNFKNVTTYCQYKEIGYFLTTNTENELHRVGNYNCENAKYYVCIASNKNLTKLLLSQINIIDEPQYIKTMHRLLDIQEEVETRNKHIQNLDLLMDENYKRIKCLQEEVEERNEHIQNLDLIINKKDKRIEGLQQEVEEKNRHLKILDETIEKRDIELKEIWNEIKESSTIKNRYINSLENDLDKLKVKNRELETEKARNLEQINEYETKIRNEEINCKQIENLQNDLNEVTQTLNNIYNSTGWKILIKLYKGRDAIFPDKSKRKLFIQIARKGFKHPKMYIKAINRKNVKKLKYYLKNESPEKILERTDKFEEKNKEFSLQPTKQIEIINIENDYEPIIFEKFDNPLVSIIIPVYNQWEYTYACLLSIKKNTTDIPYEIIIADDVSQDETKNIKDYIKNIQVIRNDKNLGFLLNCNNAATYAKGEYIHFLNNDTNVQENWLSSLLELIQNDNSIGMTGSKLIYANGKLQEAGGIIWSDASGWNYGNMDDPEKPKYNYVKDVDYISGASILIRNSLWKEIGGFDERFVPAYFEDSDLAFEVRKHGYRVVYQPQSVVVHFEGISHGTNVNSGIKSYQIKNKEKFIEKWKNELEGHYLNGENVFLARDKSCNKKTLLMIDHYVPQFDKDAGSRTVFQYLNMFVEQGFNVKFIGDNFFKHEPYTSVLQQKGIEVLYGPYYANNWKKWVKENSKHIDYIFLNRPHISEKYIDFLKSTTNSKIIYYGHDLHFLREKREYELTHNEEALRNSEYWKDVELELMRKSNMVYYPSQVEVNEIGKIDSSINAKAIPAYIFDVSKPKIKYSFEDRKDLMFIGGFGHKPNIDAVEWFSLNILPKLIIEEPDIKVYILGSNPPQEVKALATEHLIIKGFVTDEELIEFYTRCRVSVVPLRYGAGIKGKVIEAMYNQIPVMTTSVGAEGIVGSNEVLTVADSPEEFAKKLIALYRNESKLTVISEKSREYIEKHFTMDAVIQTIKSDFEI